MKTYNFYKSDTGELFEKKKCSLVEARVFANNFSLKFEEAKRKKKND